MGGTDDSGAWCARLDALLSSSGLASSGRRALDVGAGQGHLVASLLRRGFAADGVEPLERGRAAARRDYGIELAPQLPESGSYDLISLIHSLEHMDDPVEQLRACSSLLAENGRLLIEVPHLDSVDLMGPSRRDYVLSLPGHLFHFTPSALRLVARRAGLELERVVLRNPALLESVLAAKARLSGSSPGTPPPTRVAGPSGDTRPSRSGLRGRWRNLVLPWLRKRFPGWSFLAVARPAGS